MKVLLWTMVASAALAVGCKSTEKRCLEETEQAACLEIFQEGKQAESAGKIDEANLAYTKACWGGNLVDACMAWGVLNEKQKLRNSAVKAYAKACGLDNMDGCIKACRLVKPKKDPETADRVCSRSSTILLQGCQKKEKASCDALRELVKIHGEPVGALAFWTYMCDEMGSGDDCLSLAKAYFDREQMLDGLAPLNKGCELNHIESCTQLGNLYRENGEDKKAVKPLMKSCEGGKTDDCNTATEIYYALGQKKDAEVPARKACDAGLIKSCGVLGMILKEKGDAPGATAAMQKACEGKEASACAVLGALLDQAKNEKGAFDAYQKACELEDPAGCAQYGYLLVQKGEKVKALPLLQKACDGDAFPGCYNLGLQLLEDKKTADAQVVFKKACEGGEQNACKYVKK